MERSQKGNLKPGGSSQRPQEILSPPSAFLRLPERPLDTASAQGASDDLTSFVGSSRRRGMLVLKESADARTSLPARRVAERDVDRLARVNQ